VRLSPLRFNGFLNHIGQKFLWRRANFCPCRDPNTGAPDFNCQHCLGKGYAWQGAVPGMSGIAGQKIQREWAQFGMWESGDVVLTIPSDSPLYEMGEFDRVIMADSTQPFSTQIASLDASMPWPVVSLSRAFYLLDGEPEDLPLPEISDSGYELSWADPEAIEEILPISITGRRRPEYFCWGAFPSDRAHHSGADLPRRVVLRRFDLYGR
jgi:hypothetical protein